MWNNDRFHADVLLDYSEAAKRLGIAVTTLRKWVSEKRIPYVKIGPRNVRFRPDDLLSVVTDHAARVQHDKR